MTNNNAPARDGGYHTTPERLFSDSVRAGIDVAWHLTSTPIDLASNPIPIELRRRPRFDQQAALDLFSCQYLAPHQLTLVDMSICGS